MCRFSSSLFESVTAVLLVPKMCLQDGSSTYDDDGSRNSDSEGVYQECCSLAATECGLMDDDMTGMFSNTS